MEGILDKTLKEILHDYMVNKDEITVKGIIEKYKLDISPSKLKGVLPLLDSESECPYCKSIMKKKVVERGKYGDPFCEVCGHKELGNIRKTWCRCKNCDATRKEIIIHTYGGYKDKRKFSELPIFIQVIVGKILEETKFESFDIIKGCRIYEDIHLIPLLKMGIISVSPNSSIDSFVLDERFPAIYSPYHVIYDWMVLFSDEEKEQLIRGDYFSNSLSENEKIILLKQYIHKDVMNRFKEFMRERGLQLEILPTAESLFTKLYNELSYSEIITLCYHVARYCLDQTKTGKMYKKIAEKGALKMAIIFWENDKKKGWSLAKSEVGYCGEDLKWFIRNVMKSDLLILNSLI